eukprot:gene3486-6932_t
MSDFSTYSIAAITSTIIITVIGIGFYVSSKSEIKPTHQSKKSSTNKSKDEKFQSRKSDKSESPSTSSNSDLRGYKTTSDGKLTTYFHRDLSTEDKALLGSSTPKKIDISGNTESSPTLTGSVWNAAGTWEEKNCTIWATNRIKESLKSIVFAVPPEFSTIKATVKSEGISIASGTLNVVDVTAECEYEMKAAAVSTNTVTAYNLARKYILLPKEGLQPLVKKELDRL